MNAAPHEIRGIDAPATPASAGGSSLSALGAAAGDRAAPLFRDGAVTIDLAGRVFSVGRLGSGPVGLFVQLDAGEADWLARHVAKWSLQP
jgi:hypothetical protein